MLGWFPFHCFQLLPASTASRAASEGWWRKRALAASLVQLGRSSFLAAVNQTRRRCGLMVIGGKTREEERLLACRRGCGDGGCGGHARGCSAVGIDPGCRHRLPRASLTDRWRVAAAGAAAAACCFYCQAKPRRRKLGAFPTNYGTPRKALLSFLCHAIEVAAFYPLLLLHIYWSLCFCGTPLYAM